MKRLAATPLFTPILLAFFLALSILLTGSLESRAVAEEEATVVLSTPDLESGALGVSGDPGLDEGEEMSVSGNCVMGFICHPGGCYYGCGMPPLCDECEFCMCC